jgi:hypothetical protein
MAIQKVSAPDNWEPFEDELTFNFYRKLQDLERFAKSVDLGEADSVEIGDGNDDLAKKL